MIRDPFDPFDDDNSVTAEIQEFLLAMKRRRINEGEDAGVVVTETCATLLILAHVMALKIGLTREEIIDQLDKSIHGDGLDSDLN